MFALSLNNVASKIHNTRFRHYSFDEDSKMTTTDSCSYNTPGSINGWHSPDMSSTSFHNGAISKNMNYHNGYQEKESYHRSEKDDDRRSRSPKNINLCNGLKNINISNGVIPKKNHSRENSSDGEMMNGHDRKGLLTVVYFSWGFLLLFLVVFYWKIL